MFRSSDFDKSYIFHTLAELKYLRTLSKLEHSFAQFSMLWPSNTFSLLSIIFDNSFGMGYKISHKPLCSYIAPTGNTLFCAKM